jgi:hypothetical protein
MCRRHRPTTTVVSEWIVESFVSFLCSFTFSISIRRRNEIDVATCLPFEACANSVVAVAQRNQLHRRLCCGDCFSPFVCSLQRASHAQHDLNLEFKVNTKSIGVRMLFRLRLSISNRKPVVCARQVETRCEIGDLGEAADDAFPSSSSLDKKPTSNCSSTECCFVRTQGSMIVRPFGEDPICLLAYT